MKGVLRSRFRWVILFALLAIIAALLTWRFPVTLGRPPERAWLPVGAYVFTALALLNIVLVFTPQGSVPKRDATWVVMLFFLLAFVAVVALCVGLAVQSS